MTSGDEIYQRLIAPIEDAMIGVVGRIVRDPDDAADVFQEVLAEVWARLARIDRHPNPHAYIMRICVTRSHDALRRRVRRREVSADGLDAAAGASGSPGHTGNGAGETVRAALGALPPKQAQAVLLRLTETAPYRRIADVLDCSPATARSHVSKGLERLRKALKTHGMP